MSKYLIAIIFFLGLTFACSAKAETATYYFNGYNVGEAWERPSDEAPALMVDNNEATSAATYINSRVQLCDVNSYSSQEGTITKVELQPKGYTYYAGFYLRPVFGGSSDGDNHSFPDDNINAGEYKTAVDITNDTNAPETWTWTDISNLDVDVESFDVVGGEYVLVHYIKIIVTYSTEEPEPPATVQSFGLMAFYTLASSTATSTEYYYTTTTLDILNSQNQFSLLLFGVVIFLLTAIFILLIFR